MPTFQNTFDAVDKDLADLLADQSLLIVVQKQILEILDHCNDARYAGISQELVEKYGAYAVPGVISATYILSDKKIDGTTSDRLIKLLCALAQGNREAQALILRAGILRNPFVHTHWLFRTVLFRLDYVVDEVEKRAIVSILQRAQNQHNIPREVALYAIALQNGMERKAAAARVRDLYAKNFAEDAVAILQYLFDTDPDNTTIYVKDIIGCDYGQDSAAPESMVRLSVHNQEQFFDALHGCQLALTGRRIKLIEYFFTNTLCRFLEKNIDSFSSAEQIVHKSSSEHMAQYWWQAVAKLRNNVDIEPFFDTRLVKWCSTNRVFAKAGILQLFYVENDAKRNAAWVAEVLERVEHSFPDLYEEANVNYAAQQQGKKRTKRTSGRSGPSDVAPDTKE
jgi:hypothetical protein